MRGRKSNRSGQKESRARLRMHFKCLQVNRGEGERVGNLSLYRSNCQKAQKGRKEGRKKTAKFKLLTTLLVWDRNRGIDQKKRGKEKKRQYKERKKKGVTRLKRKRRGRGGKERKSLREPGTNP